METDAGLHTITVILGLTGEAVEVQLVQGNPGHNGTTRSSHTYQRLTGPQEREKEISVRILGE